MNNAVDGVLNLAFQLPAMQKLGESLGVNLELGNEVSSKSDSANPDATPE